MYTVFNQGTHMTVKNLNLAIPMDLYVALKRDAELVASPVTTHIRGVLMRYIRSTDEAVHQRKAELTASTKPVGAQQQAYADYAAHTASVPTFSSITEANEYMDAIREFRRLASNGGKGMEIPASALAQLDALMAEHNKQERAAAYAKLGLKEATSVEPTVTTVVEKNPYPYEPDGDNTKYFAWEEAQAQKLWAN
jgi:hypothetical protein